MADPSTFIGTAATASTIVKDGINLGRGLVLWIQTRRQNPKDLNELLMAYVEAKEVLARVKDWFSAVPPQPSMQSYRRVIDCRLENMFARHEQLQERVMMAVERAQQTSSKVFPSVMNSFLKEDREELNYHMSAIIGVASEVKDFVKAVNENKTSDGIDSGDRVARATIMAPSNSPRMAMDFDSSENGTPMTPKGKLLPSIPDITVFISHSSEMKFEVAYPFRDFLRQAGLHSVPFVEDHVGWSVRTMHEQLVAALQKCAVVVFVLSPDFVSKKWPMWELIQSLKRKCEARERGEREPMLLPLFYGLSMEECRNGKLCEKYRETFERNGFFEESGPKRCSREEMLGAVRELSSYPGEVKRADETSEAYTARAVLRLICGIRSVPPGNMVG